MIKKFITILFAFFFCLFISNKFTHSVQGQVDQVGEAPPAQLWRCLKAAQVGQKTRLPPPEVDVILSGVGFPSLHDIYVVLCAPAKTTLSNYKCTTGNKQSDRLIFGSDMTNTIAPLTFEVPKGTSPPQSIQASYSKVDLVAQMNNAEGHVSYAWFGVTINEPKLVSQARADTIQYATFQFQQDPAKCVSIRWDPYGRVFDSQSLEPIRGVRVSLWDKNKQLVIQRGLNNPQRTETDGVFNFFVAIKPGGQRIFYLNPLPLPPLTHTFIADPNLHPNYEKAYSDIYKPDEQIVETFGNPEHRDIPLDPGSSPPFRSDPRSMSVASLRIGKWNRYEGVISHPLSIVTLVGKNSGQEIARTSADKNGDWEILVPSANIPQSEPLKISIIKVDLTTLVRRNSPGNSSSRSAYQFFSHLIQRALSFLNPDLIGVNGKVSAQDIGSAGDAEFQPILLYIEGYAQDQNGNVMPNATVNVKLEMSDGLYYQTTADANGFFSVPPENLPIFNYYLEFVSPATGSIRMTTSEFVEKNQNHLSANNVDLMAATKNGQSLLPQSPTSPTPNATNLTPGDSNKSIIAGNKLNLILTVIALVVLFGVAGGVLMYIKKKQSDADNLV